MDQLPNVDALNKENARRLKEEADKKDKYMHLLLSQEKEIVRLIKKYTNRGYILFWSLAKENSEKLRNKGYIVEKYRPNDASSSDVIIWDMKKYREVWKKR